MSVVVKVSPVLVLVFVLATVVVGCATQGGIPADATAPEAQAAQPMVALEGYRDSERFYVRYRQGEQIIPDGPEGVMMPDEYLAAAGKPLALLGEGLAYHCFDDGLVLAPRDLAAPPHLPGWNLVPPAP